MPSTTDTLLAQILACKRCKGYLPFAPRPVVRFSSKSRILIVGQAPGKKVHESGVPWDDASGDRLRQWLGMTKEEFYNTDNIAIVPMGFCYPGKGKSGDLPPRPECAQAWMEKVRAQLKNVKLTILIGQYAQAYFLQEKRQPTLTATVQRWKDYLPAYIVLPHPSPRNNIWLKKNQWFEQEQLPALRRLVQDALKNSR